MAYNATYNHSNASNIHAPLNQANSPYGSGDPYYNESTGFITPSQPKKGTSKWIKIGIPVAVVVIAAAVVGAAVVDVGAAEVDEEDEVVDEEVVDEAVEEVVEALEWRFSTLTPQEHKIIIYD